MTSEKYNPRSTLQIPTIKKVKPFVVFLLFLFKFSAERLAGLRLASSSNASVHEKLKNVRAVRQSATEPHSWQLGCCWNKLRGCSQRGGWKRDSCAHPSLQSAECGNVWSGRRFKIMLLQALQERDKERGRERERKTETSHEVMSYIILKENDICRRST